MAVNLATKYADKIDQAFVHGSYTEKYVNKDYKFDGVKTINVYTLTTVAPSDYDRTGTGDRFGGNTEMQDVVTPYTLENDKSFKLAIDAGNAAQSAGAREAAKALRAEIDEQIIPMIDKDRFATAAAAATANSQALTYASSDNAYTKVLDAQAFLDETQAPVANRVLYVTPTFYNLIKEKITTGIHASGYNDKLVARGYVGELDGMEVVKVPSTLFPANTHAIIWQKKAVLGAKQITKAWIKEDSELVDGKLLMGRYIFDTFVLEAKKKAVSSIVSA